MKEIKKFTLLPVYKTCRACNMELLPILVAHGTGSKIIVQDTYCDRVCEKMYRQYPKMLGSGNRERFLERIDSDYLSH